MWILEPENQTWECRINGILVATIKADGPNFWRVNNIKLSLDYIIDDDLEYVKKLVEKEVLWQE